MEQKTELRSKVKWSEVTQSCPTLCDPMNCSLPGSSLHGILQARVLEWDAIATWTTALSNSMKLWRVRPSMTDGSWWRVLAKHGLLEKGMANHFIFLGSKITADGECSHEIKRCLLLGRKAMTNLKSLLKSRDITLPTKVSLIKAMVFQWSCMDLRVGL